MKIILRVMLIFTCILSYAQEPDEPKVVYEKVGMDKAQVKREISYVKLADSSLVLDIYYPADFDFGSLLPTVLIVFGYDEASQKKLIGQSFMKWQWYTSWCRLFTTENMAAIVYETTSPEKDLVAVQHYIKSQSSELLVDPERIGLFSVSINSSVAMNTLLNPDNDGVKCGIFLYPYLLTDKSAYVEEAMKVATQYGISFAQLPNMSEWSNLKPIYLVQAGKDEFKGIKETTGEFIENAHSANLPLTFINYPQGIHGFDALQDTPSTRNILMEALDFMVFHLFQD